MIDREEQINIFKGLIANSFSPAIESEYGETGIETLKVVLDAIKRIYRFLNIRKFESIIIFKADTIRLDDLCDTRTINNPAHFAPLNSDYIVIQIISEEEFYVGLEQIDILPILKENFIYQRNLQVKEESFVTKTRKIPLEKLSDSESYFAIDTFKSLEEAISHYKTVFVKPATCPILNLSFYNKNRIFFAPAPEHFLRDSMMSFLNSRLRGHFEVRNEQAIDGSHPVDLKITWAFTNHIALIEIKWLGKSLKADGNIVEYSEARARDGAQQLADYLDGNYKQVPIHNTVGYLVVFDLRRKNTNSTTQVIDRINGLHFENKEINYNPKHYKIRKDFATPIRMFINPEYI